MANVVETPGAGSSFCFDNTAPTFSGLTSATAVSATQINLSWSAASDTVTTAPNMVYEVCQSTTAGACASFFTAAVVTSAGMTSTGMNPLSAGTRYYFVVRARDEAGNSDTNAVEKSARTWSTNIAQAVTNHLGDHTCALASDGTVKCWGYNLYGQLGDGTTADKSTPVAVTGLIGPLGVKLPRLHESTASGAPARPWRRGITGGWGHTCALVSDGTARCWGINTYGQLGDGTTTNRLTPVQVQGLP